MLFAIAAFAIATFAFTLWCSVTVARISDLPWWRRCLPFALFLASNAASLLRAFDMPGIANAAAFPLNVAVIVVALAEIRASRQRRRGEEASGVTAQ
ncbi:hypothetical protein [Streptomyces formicae]|uniref:Integral membrane protein n=1 Tax=Streptomyces formicae TaxID=1616117 RepID=A0ABY3WCT3_9ACTN|nr:hypothetical protein [Streptomyces formicae]UNM10379.1 hypothetical protein J4032_01625 [Streptomyces formicae]